MTAVALPSRRAVRVAVPYGAGLRVATDDQPQALAGIDGPDQALIVADDGPRGLALQQRERFGMAFQGQRQFAAVGAVAGRRGQVGPSGSALPAIPFSYGDVSPRSVFTFEEGALLAELQLIIDTPFDGEDPALLVRTGDGLVLMGSDQNAPALVATFETTPAAQLPAGTQLFIETTPGPGATAGAGKLLLNLH